MLHFVKKPSWVRPFYGDCTWEVDSPEKVMYLTFDDGPDPEETPFVMETLRQHNAKATFFCIGQNVESHPGLFEDVRKGQHAVGNHSYSHLDGWKTSNNKYYEDIIAAAGLISSNLFRPPYGHITWRQSTYLKNHPAKLKTILWNVLSADFDANTSKEKCLCNVIDHAGPGAIVLFHDAAVASRNLRYVLPRVLEHFGEQGYSFKALST